MRVVTNRDRAIDGDSLIENLHCEDWLPQSVEEIFSFFSDAYNLEKITPDFLRFSVLAASDHPVRLGTLIDYRLHLHGIPITWKTRIEEWIPGVRFVDRQVRGPYRLWHHTHEFEEHEGGTLMRDHVRYQLPLGALGRAVAGAFVRKDVEKIFLHRRMKTRAIFGGDMVSRTHISAPSCSKSHSLPITGELDR